MTDHANKTLPLPAYLAEDDILRALLASAIECQGGREDTATPAFIAAVRQELEDRGAMAGAEDG